MTIEKQDGVRRTTVGELLAEELRIPPYQRPYSWGPLTALQLLDDIREAMRGDQRSDASHAVPYVLGAVIIHKEAKEHAALNVVDGQQRLLTLHMILSLIEKRHNRESSAPSSNPIGRVWTALNRSINTFDENEPAEQEKNNALAQFIKERCELIRVETDDIDEAFRAFDSQNYRGKPLAPHDLLKAYHLREMSDEKPATRAAVVEGWESVMDDDLDRLFSTYLYRIARWSRRESAPGFTVHDIGMFKGISPKRSRSPNARYHIAAQAAIPMMTVCEPPRSGSVGRDVGRIRFQLDAPSLAGRQFFEMVTFMLTELRLLASEAFPGGRAAFSLYDVKNTNAHEVLRERPYQSRYRYVSELYLAALLYYTNKFGDKDLKVTCDHLFAWAYSLRIELRRVQFRSMDNRARGDQWDSSAFTLIRNATSACTLSELFAPIKPNSESSEHENALIECLKKIGALT